MKINKLNKIYRRNKMFCRKRADVSIVLLVLMTLALMGATLLIFLLSGKIDKKIADAKFLETAYAVENKIDFYLADTLDLAIVKAYKDVAEEQAFVGSSCSSFGEVDGIKKEFCSVDSNANTAFKEKIAGYFKENIRALEFPESENILNGLKNNIEQNKFSVEFDGRNAVLNVKDIKINLQFDAKKQKKILWVIPAGEEITILIGVNYEPNIIIETELIDLGLADFEAINKSAAGCIAENKLSACDDADKDKKIAGFKACLEGKIKEFNVNAMARCISNKPYFLTSLTSKEFLIGKDFETIGIKFLMKSE